MAHKAEYKVIQSNNASTLGVELNQLAISGWKPILMTTAHAPAPGGQGPVLTTVIMEHKHDE
jgi:hypothetical protein